MPDPVERYLTDHVRQYVIGAFQCSSPALAVGFPWHREGEFPLRPVHRKAEVHGDAFRSRAEDPAHAVGSLRRVER